MLAWSILNDSHRLPHQAFLPSARTSTPIALKNNTARHCSRNCDGYFALCTSGCSWGGLLVWYVALGVNYLQLLILSQGGLDSQVATHYLAALNALKNEASPHSAFARLPPLSFSFGRALQGEAAKHWVRGDDGATKDAFERWSKACFLAAKGELK